MNKTKNLELSTKIKDFLYSSQMIFNENQEEYNYNLLTTLVNLKDFHTMKFNKKIDLLKFLDKNIGDLEDELSFYVNHILHDSKFQELEGRWKSIHDLIKNSQLSTSLKLFVMDVTIDEIQDDINDAPEFDQSLLFKRMYEDNYGTPGGEPIACVVFDHYFTKNPQDVKLMANMANILAAAHIQMLASVHPSVFDLKHFNQLNNIIDVRTLFDSPELIEWNAFRLKEESRYVSLLLPRVLKRIPYDPVKNPIKTFNFVEEINNDDPDCFCWGNAAFAMANCITRSFFNFEWLASIRGVENGGKCDTLPIHLYENSAGESLILCPTEMAITDRREKELSDLGFLSLCYFKQSDYSVFFGSQTVQKALIYDNPEATGNAQLSTSLAFMLNVSRFAHYMKCMIRDCIGSNKSKENIEEYLQNWIADYVTLSEDNDDDIKSRYPLKAASVQVQEKIENPGHYSAIVKIIPHFQLESINISTRLVVNLATKEG
jgi:type VI secretion system protein ImpC